MAGAYTAKPDTVPSEPSVPPGWEPTWPFPGPYPPGYEPELTIITTATSVITPDGTASVTSSLRDHDDYATIEPSSITWTATINESSIDLRFAGDLYANSINEDATFDTYWGTTPSIEFDVSESNNGDVIVLQAECILSNEQISDTSDITVQVSYAPIVMLFTAPTTGWDVNYSLQVNGDRDVNFSLLGAVTWEIIQNSNVLGSGTLTPTPDESDLDLIFLGTISLSDWPLDTGGQLSVKVTITSGSVIEDHSRNLPAVSSYTLSYGRVTMGEPGWTPGSPYEYTRIRANGGPILGGYTTTRNWNYFEGWTPTGPPGSNIWVNSELLTVGDGAGARASQLRPPTQVAAPYVEAWMGSAATLSANVVFRVLNGGYLILDDEFDLVANEIKRLRIYSSNSPEYI